MVNKRRSVSTRLYQLDNTPQHTMKVSAKVSDGETKQLCSLTVTQFNEFGEAMNIYGFRTTLTDKNDFKVLTKTLRKKLRKWGLNMQQGGVTDMIKELSKLSY